MSNPTRSYQYFGIPEEHEEVTPILLKLFPRTNRVKIFQMRTYTQKKAIQAKTISKKAK